MMTIQRTPTMNERKYKRSFIARILRLDYGVSPTSVHRARGTVTKIPDRVKIPRVVQVARSRKQDK